MILTVEHFGLKITSRLIEVAQSEMGNRKFEIDYGGWPFLTFTFDEYFSKGPPGYLLHPLKKFQISCSKFQIKLNQNLKLVFNLAAKRIQRFSFNLKLANLKSERDSATIPAAIFASNFIPQCSSSNE